jgi:hypothetical protein
LLGTKLTVASLANGSITLVAYGEAPNIDIPMLLVIEGSYQEITPVITVDDTLSKVSTNPIQN